MQTRQAKSHSPNTALTKAAESPQKAAVNAASASRVPVWTGAMNDQIPGGLILQDARTVPGIQAKLAISQPNDLYEQEADRMAEQVMRMPASPAPTQLQRKCACGGTAGPTGECEACALKRKALQRRATQSATESTAPPVVNQVLSSGNGQPLDAATRAFMEPRFGTDFNQVRVHTGGQAAESAQSVSALAYTVGSDVVFGNGQYRPETSEGQKLLAHELTHVVQQGTTLTTHHGIVDRFESPEHLKIGTKAFGDYLTDLNLGTDREPEYLTYGEMVALAGDYFESLDEMRRLASRPQGQDKIRWARWKALYEKSKPEPNIAPALKKEVMDHYYTLAARNFSHFSAGGTALDSYRDYHWQALVKAYDSGYNNDRLSWGEAMTIESFGAHYLTDMFSAGHVRTPRQAIKTWYADNFPNSIPQFVTYIAQYMHTFVANAHPYLGFTGEVFGVSDEPALEATIRELGGPALNAFSLGDIVSVGFHDRDSEGLQVTSEVDQSGKKVKGGFRFRATGDTHLSESSDTEDMAVAAVRASLADLEAVRKIGAEVLHIGVYSSRRIQAIEAIQPFQAERFIPKEDTSAANIDMNWHWGNFNKNMRDAVDKAIKGKVANALNEKAREQIGVKREALEDFVAHLRRRGIEAIEAAIGANAGGK